jgi:hypothetical protein
MKRFLPVLVCSLVVLSPLLFLGCEVASSADTQLNLNPRSVTLKYKESQPFTVSGGYDYRWTLQNETLGKLDKRTGDRVFYTSLTTNTTQLLTVESYINDASGNNSTNISDSNAAVGVTASAVISPFGVASSGVNTPIAALHILPPSANLSPTPTGRNMVFMVAEGVSCQWSLETAGIGSLSANQGVTVTYTANSWPTNATPLVQTITVTYIPSSGLPVPASVTVKQKLAP